MHPLILASVAINVISERHETAARRRSLGRVRPRRGARRAAAAPALSPGRRLKGAFR